jgi:hypothetical protein
VYEAMAGEDFAELMMSGKEVSVMLELMRLEGHRYGQLTLQYARVLSDHSG